MAASALRKEHVLCIDAFVNALRPHASDIPFVETRKPPNAPGFLNTPSVPVQTGLIDVQK